MFFKKKPQASSPSNSSPEGRSGTTTAGPSGEQPELPELGAEALKARVVGLECSLSPELRERVGTMGWESRVAGVKVSQSGGAEPQVRIEFFSDGLALEAKASIEEFIVTSMRSRYPGVGRWVVYMRRSVPPPARQAQSQRPSPEPKATEPQSGKESRSATAPSAKLAGSRKPIAGVRSIVAVASGKGGVGKSTVSVNLAVALANQGHRVGLLDADIYGPSVPMMLGIEAQPTVNDQNKIVPVEKLGIKVMSFGFFAAEDAAVIWRGPMIMKALQQFFYDVDWGGLDFLVIDLPPGTGDAQLTLVQSLPVDGAVIVTTPQNVALLDAVKGVAMFRKTEVPVLGVVENMATFHCPSCGHETPVFGAGGANVVSRKFDVPVLGQIPLNAAIREAGDGGEPLTAQSGHPVRRCFAEIASRVTERLVELGTNPRSAQGPTKVSPLVANKGGVASNPTAASQP